jgi:hypothetical protein
LPITHNIFFSAIHCEDLPEFLEVKLTKTAMTPHDYMLLEFLSLSFVYTMPLAWPIVGDQELEKRLVQEELT